MFSVSVSDLVVDLWWSDSVSLLLLSLPVRPDSQGRSSENLAPEMVEVIFRLCVGK